MSWWDIIKITDGRAKTYAAYFQYQLSQDNLLAYQIEFYHTDEDAKQYYTEILGNMGDGVQHFLLIGPDPGVRLSHREGGASEDIRESLTQMQGINRLTSKQKLDLVRQSPDTYCLVKTEGELSSSGNYFGPNTTLRYVLGNRRMFDRAVDALENSKEQVREMGGN